MFCFHSSILYRSSCMKSDVDNKDFDNDHEKEYTGFLRKWFSISFEFVSCFFFGKCRHLYWWTQLWCWNLNDNDALQRSLGTRHHVIVVLYFSSFWFYFFYFSWLIFYIAAQITDVHSNDDDDDLLQRPCGLRCFDMSAWLIHRLLT